mmetsp:Transcript_243/g.322  ORF Transcript_243/g.322 Transcript_243/m.322 type:complete len:312 (+) Transcript_243:126-1061(+)
MSTTDFSSKAQSVAKSITTSSMNPAEALAKSLTLERPSIDAAIKSYMSLCAARSLSITDTDKHLHSVDQTDFSSSSTNNGNYQSGGSSNTTWNQHSTKKCFFIKSKNIHQAALLCARSLLKAINNFKVPSMPSKHRLKEYYKDDQEKLLEFQVVRIVWNGLIKNKNKPSKILGWTSLNHVFPLIMESCFYMVPNIPTNKIGNSEEVFPSCKSNNNMFPTGVDVNEAKTFIEEFGHFLLNVEEQHNPSTSDTKNNYLDANDNDCCLIWDKDGGKAELERRRKRRQASAEAAKDSSKQVLSGSDSLTIEEIEE